MKRHAAPPWFLALLFLSSSAGLVTGCLGEGSGESGAEPVDPPGCVDGDGDGAGVGADCATLDCDDGDPLVRPGVDEVPYDGLDNDCDGATPDDDLDGDGFGEIDDCDDEEFAVHPGVDEVPYDGVDNDCDGATPDDDLDGDGFGHGDDCDEGDDAVHPEAAEVPYDGVDNDCDGSTPDDDLDGDGFGLDEDCDDQDEAVYPGAAEIPYDGVDNDCDPGTSDTDGDGDGFEGDEDCDDTNGDVHPDGVEIANGVDDDCDGLVDEDTDGADDDGDGYCEGYLGPGDLATCSDGATPGDCDDSDPWLTPQDSDGDGYSTCGGDCDDGDAWLTPEDGDGDGMSTCQGDCEDGDPEVQVVDGDGDGASACGGDCNDGDPDVGPAMPEVYYNGVDDDCSPATDDDDQDGDGFPLGEDCDDTNPLIHPGAVEVPDNGIDEDCDGSDPTGLDGDELDEIVAGDGIVLEDAMLTSDAGPYDVSGDIVVPIGTTLTLGPGVEIRFDGPYKILVHGVLNSQGQPGDQVHITSGKAAPAPGDWEGLRFETTGTGVVAHTLIDYAVHGIHAEDATLFVSWTTATSCQVGFYVEGTDASPSLFHTTLVGNETGMVASWAGWSQDVFVSYCTLSDNTNGLLATGSAGVILENSTIANNPGIGIQASGHTIWHNAITGNGVGVQTSGGWDTLRFNHISQNDVGIELGNYPTRPIIKRNNLVDNLSYSVLYVGGGEDGAVDAELNWWDTLKGTDIASAIWDFFDDVNLHHVDFVPFLRFPVASAGPILEGTIDADGDKFFSIASGGDDCDDGNGAINPDAIDDGPDGVDDDCDGQVDEDQPVDPDGDGFLVPEDCDNLDADLYPGAPETPDNGIDENCNGFDMVTWLEGTIGGVLPTDVRLTAAQSPYLVTGDIYVAPDFVLLMEPGTELRFTGPWSVIVLGVLQVAGIAGDPVIFTSNQAAPGPGDWNEILFKDVGTGFVEHALVEFASTGVRIKNTDASLSWVSIQDCQTGLRVEDTGATALVDHCTLSGNTTGLEASWSGWSQATRLRYTHISGNQSGITTTGSAKLHVENCTFSENAGTAIQADGGQFRHNLFTGNDVAIATGGGWDTIEFNVFQGNGTGIHLGSYPTRPQIHQNSFLDQTGYAVVYAGGNGNGPTDASSCWWGASDPAGVAAVIWDVFDDYALFEVKTAPVLGAPHPSAGPIPEGTVDADGDGFFSEDSGGNDCNDADAGVHPDAADNQGDGVDQDCDGVPDDGVLTDEDEDGVFSDLDCVDTDDTVFPGATEIPSNGVDEDCNGSDLEAVSSSDLGGLLPGDTLLDTTYSPYVVSSDLVVLPGRLLVIEPGVELRFDGPWMLLVKGTLDALAAPGSPIVLTSDAATPAPGDWKGLVVEGIGQATLQSVDISAATRGVEVIGADPTLVDVTVSGCVEGVYLEDTDASALLDGCTLTDNGTGLMASWAGWSKDIVVVDSAITGNDNGLLTTGSAGVQLIHTVVAQNALVGASLDGNLVSHCDILDNGVGIVTGGGWDVIEGSDIQGNGVGIEVGSYPTRPVINGNSLVGNTDFALVYVGGNGDGPVAAQGNWWGSADEVEISEMIWDLYDDTTLFEVLFDPWLDGPKADVGVAP